MRFSLFLLSLGLTVFCFGCTSDSLSSLNLLNKEEARIPGERKSVFERADPLANPLPTTFSKSAVLLGTARPIAFWPQAGGTPANNPGRIALSFQGIEEWHTSLGEVGLGLRWSDRHYYRISARPVVDQGRIYVYQQDGMVSALSLSGELQWRNDVRPSGEYDVAVGGGVATAGGRVFVGTGYGELVALEGTSGQEIWRVRLPAPTRGAPVVEGGRVFVMTQNNDLLAFRQADGGEIWQSDGVPQIASLLSGTSPAVANGVVIAPFSSGEVMALDVRTGQLKWLDLVSDSYRRFALSGLGDVSAAPVVEGDVVYVSGVAGHTAAVRIADGSRLWEQNLGTLYTPALSGNALFLIDLQQRLVALDRKNGKPLWFTQLPTSKTKKQQTDWIGPLILGETVWAFSDDGRFAQLDPKNGKVLSIKETGLPVYVVPVVAGSHLIMVLGKNNIAAFK